MKKLTSKKIAEEAKKAAEELKAFNVEILNLKKRLIFCDYFVIASGNTRIQNRAIADKIIQHFKEMTITEKRVQGYSEGSWILLDYAAVIIHVFLEERRKYYNLEELWTE
ncbi:MAG: ribosome silencing factor [Firmicutes bacterium]|nr:ribosome silencing factor [Bacillota bacterium]